MKGLLVSSWYVTEISFVCTKELHTCRYKIGLICALSKLHALLIENVNVDLQNAE